MMTNGEIRRAEVQTSALRKIADELARANKLKALAMRTEYEGMSNTDFREELSKIMEA